MSDSTEEQSLHHFEEDCKDDDTPGAGVPSRPLSFLPSKLSHPALMMVLAIGLLICNITLYVQNRRLGLALEDKGFTGIYKHGKTWEQFQTYTRYSDINQSVSDVAWATFNTTGFVAIPHGEAADFGLPLAEDFPDDSQKGVYVLSGFHEIHCVIYLREAIKELMAGRGVGDRVIHINHCYNALRQSIECRADDTPLYIPYRSRLTGDGQFRACQDWNALTNWAKDHSACWPTGHCADFK